MEIQLKAKVDRECKINSKFAKRFTQSKIPSIHLIDEADYFLLDLKEFKISEAFIGLTATTFKEGGTTIEKDYIENKLQVKICDSLIEPMIDTTEEPIRTSY